jgi:hypothetical protein
MVCWVTQKEKACQLHLRKETDPLSETMFSSFISEYRSMDIVQKPNNFECYTQHCLQNLEPITNIHVHIRQSRLQKLFVL